MELNMNIDVKVRLTALGEAILARKKLEEFDDQIRITTMGVGTKRAMEVWESNAPDSDGFRHFQLYELMNIFGKYLTEYADELPFERNCIEVEP